MAEIRSQEQFEKVRAALKAGEFADDPQVEMEVLQAAEAWKNQQPQGIKTLGFGDPLPAFKAMGDLALSGARAGVGRFAGGLAAAPFLTEPDKAQQVFGKVTESPLFNRPLGTPEGQLLGEKLAPIGLAADRGITDVFGKIPGGPIPQTIARTAVQAPIEALALRGIGSAAKASATPSAPPGAIIPEIKDLYAVGRVAFNEARINGASVRPQALTRAINRIEGLKNEAGLRIDFDPKLHPESYRLRQRLLEDFEAKNIDFDELMTLRELAGDVAGSQLPRESFRGVKLKNIIDDFVDSLSPEDMVAGDPVRATQALKSARQFWRDASAARTIERQWNLAGIDADDFTGAGFENKLRIRFRQLSRRIEQGKEKGFTPEEVAAIKKVAAGGPVENLYRLVGKMAPTGVVSAGIGAGIGGMAFGPAGFFGVPAVGALGRHLATRSTIRNAQDALNLPLMRSLNE
jgi:hypothetical protein